MSVVESINRLDQIAAQRGVMVHDVDLTAYMTEDIEHSVKSALDYAEDVASLIFCPPQEAGTYLRFRALDGKFAFRKNEMTVWSGYKGHGKSALISQAFLHFMNQGQKCFVISPEFHPARLLERLVYQKCMMRQVSEDMLIDFFNWAGQFMYLYGKQASLKPADVIALCRFAYDKFGVDHILIDSLMKCGIASDDYNGQKKFVDLLQNIAHVHGPHIHLVAHARKEGDDDTKPPKLHSVKGASEIADMVENVVIVWRNKAKEKAASLGKAKQDDPDAMMIVEAQRNAEGWIGCVPLFYDPMSLTFREEAMVNF